MKNLFLFLCALALSTQGFTQSFSDSFISEKHPIRKALRGDWQFNNNGAFCDSDPALFKKYSNHGPILRWPVKAFRDGIIEYEFKRTGSKRIVFTLNGTDGHVFRVKNGDGGRWTKTSIYSWPEPPKKPRQKSGNLRYVTKATSYAALNNQWVKVRFEFKADMLSMMMGEESVTLQHENFRRLKSEITLAFTSGRLAVRNFQFYALSTP